MYDDYIGSTGGIAKTFGTGVRRALLHEQDTYFPIDIAGLSYYNTSYIDEVNHLQLVFEVVNATCAQPSALSISDISTESATISWAAPSEAPTNGYQVYFSTESTSLGESTVPQLNIPTETTTAELSALEHNTAYYVWVRSNCGDDNFSDWSGPIIFNTEDVACGFFEIPYFEGFEENNANDELIENCITQEFVEGDYPKYWRANNTTEWYNRAPRTGGWNANLEYHGNTWMFIPLSLEGGTSYIVKFYARQDGADTDKAKIKIAYGSSDNAEGMDVEVLPETSLVGGEYQELSASFVPETTGNYYVGIHGKIVTGAWYISLDDLSIDFTPDCVKPTNLTLDAVSHTTATISWTASTSNPANYDIYFSSTYEVPDAETVPLATVDGSVTSYTITELEAETNYSVWVRSNCGGANSDWEQLNIYTGHCIPTGSSERYIASVKTTGGLININNESGASDTGYSDFSSDHICSNYIGGDATTLKVTASDGSHYFKAWIDWNNDFIFQADEVVLDFTETHITEAIAEITIPDGTPEGDYRMRIVNSWNADILGPCANNPDGEFEDYTFRVSPEPTCLAPQAVYASNVFATTAMINWTHSATNPVSYEIYYSTNNEDPTEETEATIVVDANENNYTIEDLSTNTKYYFWLRSNCGGGDYSIWLGPNSFTTSCEPYAIPYFEGFENGYSDGLSVAGCLTQESAEGTDMWVANNSQTDYNREPRSGDWNATLKYGNRAWIFIPVELEGGVSYKASVFARQDTDSPGVAQISLGFSTVRSHEMMTLITGSTSVVAGDYQEVSGLFTPASDGMYFFGIYGEVTYTPYYLSIDDISITAHVELSDEAEILSFSFGEYDSSPAVIDSDEAYVDIWVLDDTDLSNLVATFTLSEGATARVGGIMQVSGETANDFSTGLLDYNVIAENGDVKEWSISVNKMTGVCKYNEIEATLMPNPNSGQFKIVVKDVDGKCQFDLMDITGRVVYKQEINAFGTVTEYFDLDLNSGTYFLKTTMNGKLRIEKIVIR